MFEVMDKNMVEFVTHRIGQNQNEIEVYRKIMEEFYTMVGSYYGSSGNYKKDAMMRILQQIMLLQKAVSIPHKLKEYNGRMEPNKYDEVTRIINNASNDKVALGTTFIDSATYYFYKLKNQFPDRKLFLILGETQFNKRQEIITEFEATKNGILVSTQMSLSESVNIPSCDVVICEGLQYNIANMMQYIGRFTRLNSKNKTTVNFVTYRNTLEQNILALLMAKQRINEFVKQLEYKEDADIFDEFGISLDIFNSIITKSYDENGSVTLTWGKQQII
jgi:superfamily II DNA or RNA helicase